MDIVQDAFYIPDDIATGLATGLYRRIGGVVRYAVGEKRGQIVKHLKPIDLKAAEQARGLGEKAIGFVHSHKKEAGIIAIGVAVLGVGICGYNKWKSLEPKVLCEFRANLKIYIEAIRSGNMDIDIIESLMKSLELLKKHKDYKEISIQLTTEEIDVLVSRIYEYTIKLTADNSIDIADDGLNLNGSPMVNLEKYLIIQKKIFEIAA